MKRTPLELKILKLRQRYKDALDQLLDNAPVVDLNEYRNLLLQYCLLTELLTEYRTRAYIKEVSKG